MSTPARVTPSVRLLLLLIATILLPLTVAAQAVLSVSPTSVSVQANAGSNAPSQTVRVSNAGRGALKWSVRDISASWFSVSPASGVNSGTLTVAFNTAGLQAGSYPSTFRVVQQGSTTAVTVSVQATIVGSVPTLTLTACPANISVISSNGSAVVVTYTLPTASGGLAPVTVTGAPASGSSFPVGTTPVQVTAQSSDGQTANCGFSVRVVRLLTVSCPSNMTVLSSNGSPVVVNYTLPTASGGLAPVTVTGTPASGSSFPVGTTPVQVTAQSSDGQTATCGFSVIVTYSPPPPPSSTYGPQTTITCPVGAVGVWPDMSFYQVVAANAAGTTYCLKSGVHLLDRSVIPKSGDRFIGEYGAILHGTWTSSDDTEAAFRAHGQDIDNVIIRNLVIRNLRRGIHAYALNSDHWTIEFNEVRDNYSGIVFPADSLVRNNYIHHNFNLGYQAIYAHNSIVENNEIANNGWEQKIMESNNVIFRNNFVHHNEGTAIWYDSNNTGAIIENNRVEDNGHIGIWFEISTTGTIRNNVIRRSRDAGVFLSTSRDTVIHDNTLDSNFRGITYLINCPSIGGGSIFFDLVNNTARDNTIVSGAQSGVLTGVFTYVNCTDAQLSPYLNGQKNLKFIHNTYDVPSTDGPYWYWNGFKNWANWQALGQDLTGTAQ